MTITIDNALRIGSSAVPPQAALTRRRKSGSRISRKMDLVRLKLMALVVAAACGLAAKNVPKTEDPDRSKSRMAGVEVIPGASMGEIKVGTRHVDLPKRARIVKEGNEPVEGQLDEIHFVFDDGKIVDAWIDLKQFSGEVRVQGRTLRPGSSLEDVKRVLGPCERNARKGAVEYRCADNLRIATDFKEKGEYLRIHLTWPPALP